MNQDKDDKRAMNEALVTLVGRARRRAHDEPDLIYGERVALFYAEIHEIIKNLFDLVQFEITENWDDDKEDES